MKNVKSGNSSLKRASINKNDEFYTQYSDVEAELISYTNHNPDVFRGKVILLPCDDPTKSNFTKYFINNFERFGIKKLISSCFKSLNSSVEEEIKHGKVFVLEAKDISLIDVNNVPFDYLKGDGDYASDEVTAFRDEADFIITNPPFSLFRHLFKWLMAAKETKFLLMGNIGAYTYSTVFPYFKDGTFWSGYGCNIGINFIVPKAFASSKIKQIDGKNTYSICVSWYTNIEHGKVNPFLKLNTMAHNIEFSKRKEVKGKPYVSYDNFVGLEVPYTAVIPSDYDGPMGVPISFLSKFNPNQFEILGVLTCANCPTEYKLPTAKRYSSPAIGNREVYQRLLIKRR